MTQQPKVSVLISFYNLAPFVDQTMESVLAQKTDFPVEILCADDGSDDGTIEKLRGWEAAHPDTVRVFVMDRVPGKKYEGNERIRRMNAIRGRLFYEAKGSYVCYLDGDDFYTDDRKLQKQADILDADTAHKYVACGHNGCYYWQSTGETKPIEKPIRECALTAKEYWSFFYIHTNAMMNPAMLREFCRLDAACSAMLGRAMERLDLSARAYDRIVKVARTIADLAASPDIRPEHIAEAINYRSLDRAGWGR